jgi:hypothetical protein
LCVSVVRGSGEDDGGFLFFVQVAEMKNSLKGALLSGLVFPGLGQVFFRHYLRGIALMLVICVSLSIKDLPGN